MFNPGDEIECINAAPIGNEVPPFSKVDKFIVRGFWEAGQWFGEHQLLFDCVSIGIADPYVERLIAIGKLVLPHGPKADIWAAKRFRKVQKKRTREELYSLIGIDGMVDQRVPEAACLQTESRSENPRLKASARLPDRMRMAVGVAVESLTGVSRGNDGARLAVTCADAGALSGASSGRAAAAQRMGTAEGSGDGSSVRSDQRVGEVV